MGPETDTAVEEWRKSGFVTVIRCLPAGGAISNMYAMLLARYKMFPEVKEKGMSSVPKLVAFTSENVWPFLSHLHLYLDFIFIFSVNFILFIWALSAVQYSGTVATCYFSLFCLIIHHSILFYSILCIFSLSSFYLILSFSFHSILFTYFCSFITFVYSIIFYSFYTFILASFLFHHSIWYFFIFILLHSIWLFLSGSVLFYVFALS